jgi:hypothetical protein
MVPDGVPQVGWVTLAAVGTTGGVGIALIVVAEPDEVMHVVSTVFLTYKV